MRILHVDKFLRRSGGAAVYMLDLAARQEAAGHQVEFFSMQDERNLDATFSELFPPFVSLEPPPPGVRGRVGAAGRMIWSSSAAKGMGEVVARFRPDVVHLHNIYHQLSPSILRPLVKAGVPAVMTVHDYKLVCPTYRLLSNDQLCDACVGGKVWEATRRRCQGGSLPASAVLTIESGLHRLTRAYRPVGRFIAPSRFLADQLRRGGVFPERVRQLNNYVDAASLSPRVGAGEGFVSIGRLANEKGVDTTIRAIGQVPGAKLTVAGDGPQRAELEALAESVAPGQVRFAGHVSAAEVAELNRSARAAVAVARWHENMPLSVLETMGASVPLIVSGLGGLPELVDDGVNGLVVPHDDPAALAAAMRRLLAAPQESVAMGAAARAKMLEHFDAGEHLEQVLRYYAEATTAR
ncbi:MAG: glycosyltransferase family 4 protein [Acidimicrobiales bacterium]|nr:glycosyltransferase family 4 protein [Acidimicrobiales bacterium]